MYQYLQLVTLTGLVSLISYFAIILLRTKKPEKSTVREAPEPTGAWPIIGHLHLLGGGSDNLLHRTLADMADKYGAAFQIRLGSYKALVVSNSELGKECFTTHDRAVASRPVTTATKHMCYNDAVFGFGPYGSYWRHMRKIVVSELLSSNRLEIFKHVLDSEVGVGMKKLYDLWTENGNVPVLLELNRWFEDLSINVIIRVISGRCGYGVLVGLGDTEANRCAKAIAEFFRLMGVFVVSDAFPSLWWLDLNRHVSEMKKTAKELDDVFSEWLSEHQQKRLSGEVETKSELDVIDILLSAKEEGHISGLPFDEDTVIKSTCLAIFSGGGDTVALTLTWAIALLLNNRLELRKAQEELDHHLGNDRQVVESDIKNLKYLQAIIKETLRLYPVAPLSGPREALEDCTIGGYRVTAGTRLIFNIWKMQRDSNIWENPLSFKPDRFLTSHVDIDFRSKNFELIPFGAGRRVCPGMPFALQALHLTLGRLLHAFDLETPTDEPVNMAEAPGTLMPKAMPLKVLISPRFAAKLYCS